MYCEDQDELGWDPGWNLIKVLSKVTHPVPSSYGKNAPASEYETMPRNETEDNISVVINDDFNLQVDNMTFFESELLENEPSGDSEKPVKYISLNETEISLIDTFLEMEVNNLCGNETRNHKPGNDHEKSDGNIRAVENVPDTILIGDNRNKSNKNIPEVENVPDTIMPNNDNDKFNEDMSAPENVADIEEYTKKGTIRKRKKIATTPQERNVQKRLKLARDHPVKEGCKEDKCKRGCAKKIPQERREFLNQEFWELDATERRSYILHHVSSFPVKKRRNKFIEEADIRKTQSYNYSLNDGNGTQQKVCKSFFLETLGYAKNCDKFLRFIRPEVINCVKPPKDKRNSAIPHNKIDTEVIKQHIQSFDPKISHCRREHAPKRLYLPSDLSFKSMHDDFKQKFPDFQCSYDKYRQTAKEMNIAIVKLGNEDCETCEELRLHGHDENNLVDGCDVCAAWKVHIEKAKKSREKYRQNAEQNMTEGTIAYSVDLEKVIMIPRIDMFKKVIFTHRISVYNETFAPLGSTKMTPGKKIFAALWHEGIAGRTKDEIISAFYSFIKSVRDFAILILWLDNCSAQNKNWTLFSFFIYVINLEEIRAEKIILRFFEPGHTYMSADSFHHSVELSMKKVGNKIYDFTDFVNAVSTAAKNTEVKSMSLEDFYEWEDYSSQYKLNQISPRPYISEMVEVTFKKGCRNVWYKCDFDGEPFELNFLSCKVTKNGYLAPPTKKKSVNGVLKERKQEILKNLRPIIRKDRIKFWEDLPVGDASLKKKKNARGPKI